MIWNFAEYYQNFLEGISQFVSTRNLYLLNNNDYNVFKYNDRPEHILTNNKSRNSVENAIK